MIRWNSLLIAATFALAMPLTAQTVRALEIEEVQWGFDGQVVQHRFNLLSILVTNPTSEAFDGGMTLVKSSYSSGTVGAAIRQPVFLSPFSQKWIQFHPFHNDQFSEWKLRWGAGHDPRYWGRTAEERYDLNEPRLGPPAYVILNETGDLLPNRRGTGIKGLAENLFPPIVTATDGLKGVVLDHNPRWQRPQRDAFLDWLNSGGEVHLILGDDNTFPEFPSPLSDLNAPVPVHAVGQGFVYRHERTRVDLTADFVKQNITERSDIPSDSDEIEDVSHGASIDEMDFDSVNNYDFDQSVLYGLKAMTQPDHNWALIYAMSFVYLLLIFPGGYLLGRRRIDYRIMIGALLGTIALFSVGFSIVGARGYDETTTVNSVAIARPLPGGFYDLSSWSNVFVVNGNDYSITYPGQGLLYSTCQSNEHVAGFISEDPSDRRFVVDIPPYSSRPFAHRAKTPGPPLDFTVKTFAGADRLKEFTLQLDARLKDSFVQAYVLYGNRFHRLRINETDGVLTAELRGQFVKSILDYDSFPLDGAYGVFLGISEQDADADSDEQYDELLLPLVARSMNFTSEQDRDSFQLPIDRARLFLFTTLPSEFHIQEQALGQQNGRVLYCLDVLKQQ